MSHDTVGNEYLNLFQTLDGHNIINALISLTAFIGGRHVISDFYVHRQDLLCNPLIKVIILFSIIHMNIKNIKISIIIFFIYILFIDNYIFDDCNKEFI